MNFAFAGPGPARSNGRGVAVIGAGPSGLAAAGFLACLGYQVDVYDKLPKPGGLMVFGIPAERIPAERIGQGVETLASRYGVRFHTGVKICDRRQTDDTGDELSTRCIDLDDLVGGHDAVMLCTGSWKPRRLNVPGEDLRGVYTGLAFLFPIRAAQYNRSRMSAIDVAGKNVIVIGAGFSAIDVAHGALGQGAARVSLIYRRTRREAPCGTHEIEQFEAAGGQCLELVTPIRVLEGEGEKHGQVAGIECIQCHLGEPDADGRRRAVPDSCAKAVLPADIVVTAIGETAAPPFAERLGLESVRKNEIHWLQMTRMDGVFVAGDALTGPSKIGKAVYSGLRAAQSLSRWLTLRAMSRELEYRDDAPIRREDLR
ncbi:MAG: glutamate synthase [Desulfovibrionaceae bacterium CG1_02_65_16]|nr:MAG: glutamate synthase [Desulfovibrionaceae bacterium CG1_02_65_16]